MANTPTNHNWRLVVVANDFHIPFHDETALALLQRFLKDQQPRRLILNGDFQDFWEVSSFDKAARTDAAFEKEVATGTRILHSLRRAIPEARITWIEGNHEFRLRRYLWKNAPALARLPALTVPELFDLRTLGIEYHACPAAATKFVDNFVRVGKLHVGHFDKVASHGGYAAKALVSEKGASILQGHTHRFGAHARTTVDGRVLLGIENASMCRRSASYVSRPNWQVGFSAVYVQKRTGEFHWHPVLVTRRGFVWNGTVYRPSKPRRRSRAA